MNIEEDLDFAKICRICFIENTTLSLFTEAMHKKLMYFASIQVWPNDGLPSRICNRCLHNLYMCFKFKKLCEKSDSRLRRQVARASNNPKEPEIISIEDTNDRVHAPEIIFVDCVSSDSFEANENDNDVTIMEYEEFPDVPVSNVKIDDQIEVTETKLLIRPQIRENQVTQQIKENQVTSSTLEEVPEIIVVVKETFKCITCKKDFASKKSLKNHMKIHEPITYKECDTCNEKIYERFYKSHLSKCVSAHFQNKPHECKFCSSHFATKKNLDTHIKTRHSKPTEKKNTHNASRIAICPICDKLFPSTSQLMLHCVIHAEDKPYGCGMCDKRFSTTNNLDRHREKVHPQS